MTDEEKEAKSEQLHIIGMLFMAFCASFILVVCASALSVFAGIEMIDNYRWWAWSPFLLIAGITSAYGIIRWAVHFGMMSAMRAFAAEQIAEAQKARESFDEVFVAAKQAEPAAEPENKTSEWKEVKRK